MCTYALHPAAHPHIAARELVAKHASDHSLRQKAAKTSDATRYLASLRSWVIKSRRLEKSIYHDPQWRLEQISQNFYRINIVIGVRLS